MSMSQVKTKIECIKRYYISRKLEYNPGSKHSIYEKNLQGKELLNL